MLGANVVYNQPNWIKKQLEEEKREDIEDKKLKEQIQIPAPRYPGVGAEMMSYKIKSRYLKNKRDLRCLGIDLNYRKSSNRKLLI